MKFIEKRSVDENLFRHWLFKQGILHKINVIKKDDSLFMRTESEGKEMLCHWKTDSFPPVLEGRIGLRHLWTRSARYANIRVSSLKD